MNKYNLKDMTKGWFVGNFKPSIHQADYEVSVKRYKVGDYEPFHYHLASTEITVIVFGEVEMNGVKYIQDDIIEILPGEGTDFRCLTDVVTTVVKTKSISNDKFVV